jgi:hypothetical protein
MSSIAKLTDNKTELIIYFNKILLTMVEFIALYYSESHCATHISFIRKYFKTKPKKPIMLFINYVYAVDEYRKNILKGNDEYFMGHDEYTDDESSIAQIFEFKMIWIKMDDKTRKLIKNYMKLLVEQAEVYLDILSEINKKK